MLDFATGWHDVEAARAEATRVAHIEAEARFKEEARRAGNMDGYEPSRPSEIAAANPSQAGGAGPTEFKTIAAEAAPVTDKCEPTAIAAAWTEDRGRDIIHRGAFSNTIAAVATERQGIAVALGSQRGADKIIGHIDPLSMVERDDGLYVEGALDIENSQLAREAWRLVKAGVVGLSFGFVPTR